MLIIVLVLSHYIEEELMMWSVISVIKVIGVKKKTIHMWFKVSWVSYQNNKIKMSICKVYGIFKLTEINCDINIYCTCSLHSKFMTWNKNLKI